VEALKMTMLPLDAAGHRPAFFGQDGMDQLLSIVLELAAELWVVRERVFVVEAVLQNQGIAVTEAVEAFVPDAAQQAKLASMRASLTSNMFRTLNREHRPVG
jgi:hypothetical protein